LRERKPSWLLQESIDEGLCDHPDARYNERRPRK
jgi:hypothetical protein